MLDQRLIDSITKRLTETVGDVKNGGYGDPALRLACPEFLWDMETEKRLEAFNWMDRVIAHSSVLAIGIVSEELSGLDSVSDSEILSKFQTLLTASTQAEERIKKYFDIQAANKNTQRGAISDACQILRSAIKSVAESVPTLDEKSEDLRHPTMHGGITLNEQS